MIRITKIIVACCLLMVATPLMVEAAQGRNNKGRQNNIHSEPLNVQAGIKAGVGQTVFLVPTYIVGAYGSYKIADFLSIGGDLTYIQDYYFIQPIKNNKNLGLIQIGYIPISIIAKIFPPKYPNFRFLGGMRFGYIVTATVAPVGPYSGFEAILNAMDAKSNSRDILELDKDDGELNRWTFDLLVGYEYEHDHGFFAGIEFSKGLMTISDKFADSSMNFTFRSNLGYNFAKFFE